MNSREIVSKAATWVVKIGSSLLTDNGRGLNGDAIDLWAKQIVALNRQGISVVLVSSGAVAEGVSRLGLPGRPTAVHDQQAAAAVGQMGLVQAWESRFKEYGKHTAQILLTHDDLSNRKRYLNAASTLHVLLKMGVVPVVNENDTVVTDEICFGDNDTLAGLVANLINADMLLILTDTDGLFDADPRLNSGAKLIGQAQADDVRLLAAAGSSHGELGKGGMQTKVKAAQLASRSGTATVIARGSEPDIIVRLQQGEALGTLLVPEKQPLAARKQWLASHLQVRGHLVVDAGAARVLKASGRSLLPVGVKSARGRFMRGDMVSCEDEQGVVIARGLVNYSHEDACKIIGRPSDKILELLGYDGDHEIIHRNNMVVLQPE